MKCGWDYLQARIPSDLKNQFDAACKDNGVTMTQVLIELIEQWVKKNAS